MNRWMWFVLCALLTCCLDKSFGQNAAASPPTVEEVVAGTLRMGSDRHAQAHFDVFISNPEANRLELHPLLEAKDAGQEGLEVLVHALREVIPLTRGQVDSSQYGGIDQPSRVRSGLDQRATSSAANAAWILCRMIAISWRREGDPKFDAKFETRAAHAVCELLGTGWGDGVAHSTLKTIGESSLTPLLVCMANQDGAKVTSAIDALVMQGYYGRETEVYAAAMQLRNDGRKLVGPRIDTVGKHANMLAQHANAQRYLWDVKLWPLLQVVLFVLLVALACCMIWQRRRWYGACPTCGEASAVFPRPKFRIVLCRSCGTVLWYVADNAGAQLVAPDSNGLLARVAERCRVAPELLRQPGATIPGYKSIRLVELIHALERSAEENRQTASHDRESSI